MSYVTVSSDGSVKTISKSEFLALKNKPLPSKAEMARNVVGASLKAIYSGGKKAPPLVQEHRHTICKTNCEWYRQEDDRCAKCGCYTSFKSRLEAWHCPIDKW
jgi:hypothetical protein